MSDPTPDPELTELASAYLDGAADEAEIARVESDPELLTEVERLRIVRALVSTSTEEAALSVREGHLAAALDVFDRMSPAERTGEVPVVASGVDDAAAAAISTPTPIGSRRSGGAPRPIGQWLLGAAAALLLVVGGLAVFRASQGDDDDGDFAADEADADTEAPAELDPFGEDALPRDIDSDDAADGDDRELLPADDSAFEDAESDLVAEPESADAADASASTEAMDEEEAAEDVAAMDEDDASGDASLEAGGADESGDDGGVQPSPGPEIDLPTLADEIDLGDFAAQAIYPFTEPSAEAPDPTGPATTVLTDAEGLPSVLRCLDAFPFQVVAGPALLIPDLDDDGVGDLDAEPIEVLVGVVDLEDLDDETVGQVIAVDIRCEIVSETDLPTQAEFEARAENAPGG